MALTAIFNGFGTVFNEGMGARVCATTVTLTNAQIIALPTTAVTLVGTPGSGLAIEPLMAFIRTKTASGAYGTINAAAELRIRFGATAQGLSYIVNDAAISFGSTTPLTDLLGSTTNKRAVMIPEMLTENQDDRGPMSIVEAASGFTNTALTIAIENLGSGILTGGHATNAMAVTVLYLIVAVP